MTVRPARLACAAALVLAACQGADPSAPVGQDWPSSELRTGGKPVAAALGPGETHRYRLSLRKGFLLRLVVDQQGIDAVVSLEDPGGKRVLKADRAIDNLGLELVLAVAETDNTYTLVIHGLEDSGPGRYEARVETLRPASPADRRSAAAYRLFTGANDLEPKKPEEALALWTQARVTWRELGEVFLEAEALERIARYYHERPERELAVDRYREAATGFKRARSPRWEAIARNGLGANLLPLGEAQEAGTQYAMALVRARQAGDRLNQAKALHGLGQAFQYQGELQRPLDHYGEALELWPKSAQMRTRTLHQLGVLYARYLRDERRGAEFLLKARAAWKPDEKREKGVTASQLGRLAYVQGRLKEARQYFEEALALRGESDPCANAVILARLALVEETQGVRPAADMRREEALRIVGIETCSRSEPTVHSLGADLAEARGEPAEARKGYHRSKEIFSRLGDRMGIAESWAGIARSERSLGNRQAALEASRQALEIVEGVRPTVLSEDLRTSFFSGARDLFDFHIELLLEMGAKEEAWATAERARVRALVDLLAEAGAGLRRDTAPGLAEREQALQRQLNVLETRRLAAREANEEKLLALREAIDDKVAELERLRGEIRRGASLAQLEPFSLAAARRELDSETVLLEYRLGETASTVWAVTRDTLAAFRLPPRSEIETAALKAVHRLRSLEWPRRSPQPLCELGDLLLARVEPFLRHRRVVVVADGALEALPFAALPLPSGGSDCRKVPVLIERHEVVSLPSMATLLTQRLALDGRRPAPGWLAAVADPAYDPTPSSGRARPRLPASAEEAMTIVERLPADKVLVATGAAASREIVTGGVLRGFRILHIATHGNLNADQPLLSALALAELDARGRRVQGALPAHEIYGLDLPAELVVLSACETALGREVPGEGLVSGLPRAFLYAGSPRVLVSLWKVDDESTRDLMVLFYQGLLDRRLPPDRALAEAQRALRREGRRPRDWAGFFLLGDWRPLPPFSG